MQEIACDYVVVGAGSAGCALAYRLAQSGRHKVVLVEAGGRDSSVWIHMPLGIGYLLQNERYMWKFETEPEAALGGQRIYWPRGKVIGGSSAVNGMVYAWGEAAEYDAWRDAGNAGWGFDDLLPYFMRMETYPYPSPAPRGKSGPVRITNRGLRDPDPLSDAFLAGCIEAGIPATEDYNDGRADGASYLQQTAWRGRRWTTATAYLKPARRLANFTLLTNALATRILFEGKRATGVEFRKDGATGRVLARGEVVLCAGTVQSPQLLEVSGVGRPEVLGACGVDVHHALAGVGENLQDHLQVRLTYHCSRPLTINDILNSRFHAARAGLRYLLLRKGLLASTSSSVHALARTRPDLARPDVKLQIAHISGKDRYSRAPGTGVDEHSGFALGLFKLHPKSRGSCHITSPDTAVAPAMRANYLADPEDGETIVRGMELIRRIAEAPSMRPMIVAEKRPGPAVSGADELLAYVRQTGQTSWHPISTCRMGSDEAAVVDAKLRVRGIDRLRIADCSIMPTMASSNTNAPAIMIGEKGADLVLADASSR
ncbi:MAG: GMC family oxidoreductase [Hyphomicrobiaceae bacterium]